MNTQYAHAPFERQYAEALALGYSNEAMRKNLAGQAQLLASSLLRYCSNGALSQESHLDKILADARKIREMDKRLSDLEWEQAQ